MPSDSNLFADLDERLGLEQQPQAEGYSILGKAAGDPAEEGRIAQHHVWRVKQARDVKQMQGGAIAFEIERAKQALREAEDRMGQVDRWFAERSQFDRQALLAWYRDSPLFTNARKKSTPMGDTGTEIGSKTKTVSAQVSVVNELALTPLFPECTVAKLVIAAVKKLLKPADAGRVMDTRTGELLPEGAAVSSPAHSEEVYFLRFGKDEVPLTVEWEPETDGADQLDNGSDQGADQPDAAPAADDEHDAFGD